MYINYECLYSKKLEEGETMSLSIHIRKKLVNFTLEVNIDIEDGNFALLGASGSGKSMLLKCIAGIEKPDEGRIVINDHVVFDSNKNIHVKVQERKCGFVFQNYALFPNMTVTENIACGIKQKKHQSELLQQLLIQYDLEEVKNSYPAYLSGGQQQRCAIARTMASNPKILLLDEPFSALDKPLKQKLIQDLKQVLTPFKGTTIFVSHDHEEVYRLANKVGILERGKLIELDDKVKVYHTPSHISCAKQVGIRNISCIDKIDSHTIYAKDWDIVLKINQEVQPFHTHIGIRELQIQMPITNNVIDVEVIDTIQEIYGEYVIIRKKGSNTRGIICRKECVKSKKIYIPEESIFLMKSE